MYKSILKAVGVAVAVVLAVAVAATAQATWDCGAIPGTVTATWVGGTLTISGEGPMADGAPWSNIKSAINVAVIEVGVTSVGANAFYACSSLTSVTIPNGVTSIGEAAFYSCTGLTSITIPNGVTSIGRMAFGNCTGLTSMTIPVGVTSIGDMAFQGCNGLTSVTIPNSVTSIGHYAFSGCAGLTSITIPNSVISLGAAFYNCTRLTSVTIPNEVTFIEAIAFSNCTSLVSVTIPAGVTSIGTRAFANCKNLTSITSLNPIPPTVSIGAAGTFLGVDSASACLYVPEASVPLYRAATGWKGFACVSAATVSATVRAIPSAQRAPHVTVRGRTLNIDAGAGSRVQVRVINMTGRTVASFNATGSAKLSLKRIPSGAYVVETKRAADGRRITSPVLLK